MSDAVIQCAIEAGAVAAAFAQCGPIEPRFADIYDDWLARGANAGMDYMDRYRDIRNDPRLLLEGARSMLCCAFPLRPICRRQVRIIQRLRRRRRLSRGFEAPTRTCCHSYAANRTRLEHTHLHRHRPFTRTILGHACRGRFYRNQQPAHSTGHRL